MLMTLYFGFWSLFWRGRSLPTRRRTTAKWV